MSTRKSTTKARPVRATKTTPRKTTSRSVAKRRVPPVADEGPSIEAPTATADLGARLVAFMRVAEALLESLRPLPDALASVARATQTLAEIAEGLDRAQAGLQDAVFHLPRASEYEPLVEPLREFARLSPALLAALESAPRLTAALEAATQRVEAAADSAETHASVMPGTGDIAAGVSPAATELLSVRLDRIGGAVEAAREAIRAAVATLPAASDYAPVARQLKELASVSPSLLEWMREVPRLTTPLAGAIDALNRAADELDGAFVDVELTRRDLDAIEGSR